MRISKFAHSLSRALCLALAAGVVSVAQANAPDPATLKKISALAVPFVPNAGQWDSRAAFAAQTFAGTLFVTTQGELVYSLPGKPIDGGADLAALGKPATPSHRLHKPTERTPGWTLTETLVDASGKPRSMAGSTLKSPAGYRPMQASVSYFIGSDETKHAKRLNTYERVNFGDMYPGINLQLRATGNNIEKIFTVAPSFDPKQISIALKGADKLEIGKLGELIVHTGNGPVSFTAPIAFQENDQGERVSVDVAYALVGVGADSAALPGTPPSDAESSPIATTYTFTLGAFDPTRPLVIDPLLRSTYLGAAGNDQAFALAIHPASGEVVVAGFTSSPTTTFPGLSGGAQGTSGGGEDAFVSRFSADLGTLLRSTYLGAAGFDQASALAIHPASGEVYVAGYTDSPTTSFPGVSGGAQGTRGGDNDAFVSRFSADLTLNVTTPNAYAFATQTNVPLASTRTSNPALITGIVGAANIYVDGALGSSYCISSASNCSCDVSVGFVSVPGTIAANNYVCVRHVSAPIDNEVVRSKLHIGGAVASFISTTGTTFTSCSLDIDGSGGLPNAVSDGLMLVRAMLGFTGTAVTNGAIVGTPPRNTWPLIRTYLNDNCGTSFLP
mgnify:CR=1 FL=1